MTMMKRMWTNGFLLSLILSGASAKCLESISFFITTPPSIDGLTGSCLLIPCNFSITKENALASTESISGIWLISETSSENFVYDSKIAKTKNKYPMTLIGNMSENNCSTLFSDLKVDYTNKYFFRIETEKYKSYACEHVNIAVRDSPPRPTLKVRNELKEKETVNISCSAATPCPQSPPTLTWNLQQPSGIIREQNEDGTSTSKIQATVTLSHQHDGLTINCSASYPVKERTMKTSENMTLNVKYTPKNTTAWVSPSAVVSAGTFVNFSCSSRANPPVSGFTWFRISTDGARNVSEGDLYNFNVTEGGEYYCVARNQLGNETSGMITLIIPGHGSLSFLWWILLVGVVGLLICLLVYFWWLKSAGRAKNQAKDELASGESKVEEELHYGEVFFSKRTDESEDAFREEPETLYSQVAVSRAAGPSERDSNIPVDT